MKKMIVFLLMLIIFPFPILAENLAQILPISEKWKYLIGDDIQCGDYYLLPIQDMIPCSATLQYTIIHDYESKQHENEARDYTQQPELSYPEHADHFIHLNDGDLLMMFSYPKCDVLLIPKGQDSTQNLSNLSYSQLVALKNQINLAIWKSDEWQEVTVPQGTWKVGEDIPAGKWSVKCATGANMTQIDWGEKLSSNGEDIAWSGRYSIYNTVYNENMYSEADRYIYVYRFEVKDGDYIKISDGSAVFMPYIGKPSFNFK